VGSFETGHDGDLKSLPLGVQISPGGPSDARYGPYLIEGYEAYIEIKDGKRRTVLKHREVLEAKLGRKLLPSEIVHHDNEVKTDNNPENLLLHTRVSHGKLHASARPAAEVLSLVCLKCGSPFTRLARHERHNRRQGKAGPFCSRRCGCHR
jgi:hypothetical protein